MKNISVEKLGRETPSCCKSDEILCVLEMVLASLCLVPVYKDQTCGEEMKYVFVVSAISIYFKALSFFAFQLSVKVLKKCHLCCLWFKVVSGFCIIAFYLGWAIYVCIAYSNMECDEDSGLADGLALTLVIYYWIIFTFGCCCLSCLVCAAAGLIAVSSLDDGTGYKQM